ncbi:hypothetical protein SAMN02799630_00760 [Paenibacillus sp. UNCCL117]|uniref:hypothetical protein n=1 Tax=unclassified Paenibacillus TaxID=185978 RepID=UPI00088AFC5F|nr:MULTISPECIES: hypothetical protein [unclassified Paenibacillus]SDC19212.1 hypothetical protein SAMN04488602_101560 [Paenibacillus sp. cl123]SFW18350.1 hypothetical protein SAMN02799630_00760 [Paenibacillus sp. UNCCL117]
MSRLHDIVENHEQLGQLNAVLTHYGVNAAFVAASLLQAFEQEKENEEQPEPNQDLITDLKQLVATY